MSTHHMEEEQVENLKRFWKMHGNKIIIVFAVVLLGIAGILYYQKSQSTYYEQAAVEYHKFLEIIEAGQGQPGADPLVLEKMNAQAELLKKEYAKSPYAAASAMLLAKQDVEANDLEQAKVQLEWVSLNSHDKDLEQLAHARLARILLQEKNYEAALAELDKENGHRYESVFQDIRGDILFAMKKPEEARAAYQAALNVMPDSAAKMLIQMKHDDLASSNDVEWTPIKENAGG